MADDELPFRYVPPPDPNLGRRVDTYFILRVMLGKGGMGAVYLAEHEALAHVKCVIKLVLVEMTRHPMIISRYHNEAKALALLKHDNIVKLHGLGVLDDGQLYLRFEYVEGKSLDRYLAEHGGRLPLRKAVNFVFQLCWALQHAHDRGVIHRDLKPENMIVEVDPPGSHVKERIKILDFGIAKVVSGGAEVTGAGMQMGTPTYMAPEQVTNAAGVDGRADIFGLAQVFYKMVTGTLPWGNPESSVEIYHRQRTRSPDMPPSDLMPPEVVELVFRALSLNANHRPTAHEFALELASRLKNGTELLGKVVPDWVASTPPNATTLSRPAEPTPPGARSLFAGTLAPSGSEGLSAPNVAEHAAAPSGPVKEITAHARPRALVTPQAPAGLAALRSPGVALNKPATRPETAVLLPYAPGAPQRPPTLVLAALPTGLASQQFAAQEPPVEARVPQAEVASEIDLAAGTPGPLPYAHAELPAVLVSHTQLSGLPSQVSAPGVSWPEHREPPPFVMLPTVSNAISLRSRSGRSKLALLVVASALAAVTAFAISRLGSHMTATDDHRSAAISSDARSPRPIVAGAVPDAVTVGSGSSAATTETSGVDAVPTSYPDGSTSTVPRTDRLADGTASTAPRTDKPAGNAAPDSNRAAVPRPLAPKRTLQARQLEARTSGAQTGNLHLLVTPWAVCWVDGEKIDQTPCMLDGLPVGRYRVRLENSRAHKDVSLSATVTAGETTTIERTW